MTDAPPPVSGWRRALRYAAVALAALAFVQAVRVWESTVEVQLSYEAPPGPLRVELLDGQERLRRVEFGAGAERTHAVKLTRGDYRVRLSLPTRDSVVRRFTVADEGAVTVRWPR